MWKPTSQGEDHMQVNGFPLSVDEYPACLSQDTDTATPHTPIPIYYIHDLTSLFCANPRCICQRGRGAVTQLYREVAAGTLRLMENADLKESVMCQHYGHEWKQSELPGVKTCSVCGLQGYCAFCLFMPPPNVHPFRCHRHAQRQVQS